MSVVEAAFCRSASWNRVAGAVVPWSLRSTTPGSRVLEVGCGTGAVAEQILSRYPVADYIATDIDPAMVSRAERRLARFAGRATTQTADALALPFDSGSFDTVLSFLMLHHTLQWEQVVAECVRVLRPGGQFVGYDLLSTPIARTVHRLDRSPFRLVRGAEFEAQLRALPVAATAVDASLAGHVMRFVVAAV